MYYGAEEEATGKLGENRATALPYCMSVLVPAIALWGLLPLDMLVPS